MLCIIYKNGEIFKYIETENPENVRDYFNKLSNTQDDTEWKFERYYGSKKFVTIVKNGIYGPFFYKLNGQKDMIL